MKTKLRRNERCPLHGRFDCCGRELRKPKAPKYPTHNGVTTYPDGREECTPAILRRRKDKLIRFKPYCGICEILNPEKSQFTEYDEIELSHKESKGHGGFKHDDRIENLFLAHKACNRDQGSRSFDDYIAMKLELRSG